MTTFKFTKRSLLFASSVFLLWSCSPGSDDAPVDAGQELPIEDPGGTDVGSGGDVIAQADEGSQPPASCFTPDDLPPDPLTLVGSVIPQAQGQKHLVDIQYDPSSGRIYGAGMPALAIAELSDGTPVNLGSVPGHVEHVEVLNETYLALSSRGFSSKNGPNPGKQWVSIYDVSDPASIQLWSRMNMEAASGMAVDGTYLYVVSHDGQFRTIDFNDVQEAGVVASIVGLGNPWELVVAGTYAYVADNADGIVVVDISDPLQPILGNTVSTPGGLQDIDTDGTLLYAAMGSVGVGVFTLTDPTKPELIGSVDTGGAAISVSISGTTLWSTNQESVSVIDVQDPANPVVLAVEDTPSWAMHVDAHGDMGYVADWKTISVFHHDSTALAPDVDPALSDLYFVSGIDQIDLELTNRGGANLDIVGLSIPDDRFQLSISAISIEPGDSATITVVFTDDGKEVDTEMCISTNDPDEPMKKVRVASTNDTGSSVKVGEAAPNFLLPGLDGNFYELHQQLGKPVVLCYFATW